MSEPNPSWRHHYIPEFYLKRWISGKGQLIEFSQQYGGAIKPRRRYPRETGFEDRLLSIRDVAPEISDYFEKQFFSPVDSRAAVILSKMEQGVTDFSVEERVAWAQFMLSIMFRNPLAVTAAKKRLARTITVTSKKSERRYRSVRGDEDPYSLREAMFALRESAELDRVALSTLASTSQSELVISHLCDMKWGRLDLAHDVPALLTCDRPIIWVEKIEDPACLIIMPTSPKAAFYACHSEDQLRFNDAKYGNDIVARYINETLVRRALKYVYAIGSDRREFIEEYFGKDPPIMIPDLFARDRSVKL